MINHGNRRDVLRVLLTDTDKRRELFARTIVAAVAISGRDITIKQAYRAYDAVQSETSQEGE